MAESGDLDELFGEGSGQPEPRRALIVGLLISGMILTVGGLICTAAPGGMVVLAAWVTMEKEIDRLETGYLPDDERPGLLRLQRYVQAGLFTVVAIFLLQIVLLCNGFYNALWGVMFSSPVGF